MRVANYQGRLTLLLPAGGVDVETASGGRFGADPQAVFGQWRAFSEWAADVDVATAAVAPVTDGGLGPPVPRPTQVFAIGLNYREHAAEGGVSVPTAPATFTKFPTCMAAPNAVVTLPSAHVDWEVELVVVIGALAHHVDESHAWEHVAGLTVGQDLSERVVQFASGGHFSLGKSFPGFGPIGPWLVTADEVPDPEDLELGCTVNGEQMQKSRTSEMVFPVRRLIAELSAVLPLLPGDIIFTGTPSGVGFTRTPPRYLAPGDQLTSWIEGIGELHNRMAGP
jgi:2-keto-4-pentenoate hydratase/2-oxohepta-3-ene-1,7-dioic acid hydratase in catechol pathway